MQGHKLHIGMIKVNPNPDRDQNHKKRCHQQVGAIIGMSYFKLRLLLPH